MTIQDMQASSPACLIPEAWQGLAWPGEARRGRAGRGLARPGVARRGRAGQGKARKMTPHTNNHNRYKSCRVLDQEDRKKGNPLSGACSAETRLRLDLCHGQGSSLLIVHEGGQPDPDSQPAAPLLHLHQRQQPTMTSWGRTAGSHDSSYTACMHAPAKGIFPHKLRSTPPKKQYSGSWDTRLAMGPGTGFLSLLTNPHPATFSLIQGSTGDALNEQNDTGRLQAFCLSECMLRAVFYTSHPLLKVLQPAAARLFYTGGNT